MTPGLLAVSDPAGEWWIFAGMLLTAPLLPALHLGLLRLPRLEVGALPWACALYGTGCGVLLAGFGAAQPRPALIVFCLWLILCLGYLQLVSMVTRSISLRLLLELSDSPGASRHDLLRGYAAGRGFDWLLEKRLDGLTRLGLIRRGGSDLAATGRGLASGRVALLAKRLLGLGETG